MKGKTGVDNASVFSGSVKKVEHAEPLQLVPPLSIERMNEIIVDLLGPQFLQLSRQEAIHVRAAFDQP